MKIMLDGEEIEVTKIKQSEFYDVLKDKVNILLFGKSGWGKSQIVKRYCNDNELKLKTISLASKLPESIGGIPHATDKGYYEELLSEELKDVFEDDGEGWVIFFDEINQAVPEVLNTLYQILLKNNKHPDCNHKNQKHHEKLWGTYSNLLLNKISCE